jgi:hypothetical protein
VLLKNVIPHEYIDTDTIKEITANKTFEHLYDFFEQSQDDPETQIMSGEKPKFVFINNKYPTPDVYQAMMKKSTAEQIVETPMEERCRQYFTELHELNPNWMIHDLEAGYQYDRFIFDTKEKFLEQRYQEFRTALVAEEHLDRKLVEEKDTISEEEVEEENKIIDEKARQRARDLNKKYEWEAEYEKQRKESYNTEVYMSNSVTHLRVFSQCYLEDSMTQEQHDRLENFTNITSCAENEKRLFKFLTRKLPKYVRWNREEIHDLPIMEKYLSGSSFITHSEPKTSSCFIRDLKEAYNGKGIAISAADMHMDELLSLIMVLRGIKNELPIQIVHRGDLSEASQNQLTHAARTMELKTENIRSFQSYLQTYHADFGDIDMVNLFPQQEIWYVDASGAINPEDHRFVTYGNKLLTLFFSSFEDTVLIDTDTVPFVNIDEYILKSDVYKEVGAFFFKDRMLYDRMTGPDITFFKKLLPNRLDTAFFDIPELTNYTMQNRFFGEGFKHVQESGMVAINKKKHIRSTLFINLLQMWHAATLRVHGDKELFWLGFSIAGDEDYYMNKYGVGAVGNLNPDSNRLLGDADDSRRSQLKSHMLCTTHPAHLSGLDDHTLLWMNSGFITCKRPEEAEKDITMDLYKNVFESAEQLKENYVGPLKISAVLVPPPQERVINNELGEPSSGWDVMFGCGGYLYCAYDRIGGSDDPFYIGTLVEYDERQQIMYDYLGELWVYYKSVIPQM